MRRRSILALALAVPVTFALPRLAVRAAGTYSDPMGRFTFTIPDGYELGKDAPPAPDANPYSRYLVSTAEKTAKTFYKKQVSIAVNKLSAPVTLDQYAQITVNNRMKDTKDFMLGTGGVQSAMLGGQSARVYDYTYSAGTQALHKRDIFTILGDSLYSVSFDAFVGGYDAMIAETASLVPSFMFSSAALNAPAPAVMTTTASGEARTAFAPAVSLADSATARYFAETKHTLKDQFKAYWEANGGLALFGYPISEPFTEKNADDGKSYTVQYFERNRFELHPENAGTPNAVLLGLLGKQLTAGRGGEAPFAKVAAAPDGAMRYAETGHSLGGTFATYWAANGGLAVFGYPISEPFTEKNADDGKSCTVQYFERNRFELHPENAGTPYEVLLGQLGKQVARQNGLIS